MSKFVKCVSLKDFSERLIALNSVRRVYRDENPERAAIVEDYNNHLFECTHELIASPRLVDCIVEL